MNDSSVPAPEAPGVRYTDLIIIYGVKLNSINDFADFSVGRSNKYLLRSQLVEFITGGGGGYAPKSRNEYSIALTYAYAYDGHCYRCDTLRTFIVIGPADQPAVGCGFDVPAGTPIAANRYRMWRIRAADELLELMTNYGDAKTLILDANLPGKRSPTSYAINQSMGHRGGRLTQD